MIYRVIAFNFLQSKVRANKNSPSSFTENTEKPDTQARKTSYSFSDFDPVRTLLIFRLKKKKKKKKRKESDLTLVQISLDIPVVLCSNINKGAIKNSREFTRIL